MKPYKCLESDSFNMGFNQKNWPVCEQENFQGCCNWLVTVVYPPFLIWLALLLFLNVMRKIPWDIGTLFLSVMWFINWFPKSLLIDWKLVMSKCIFINQSTFILDRSILIMSWPPLTWFITWNPNRGKVGDAILKFDIRRYMIVLKGLPSCCDDKKEIF